MTEPTEEPTAQPRHAAAEPAPEHPVEPARAAPEATDDPADTRELDEVADRTEAAEQDTTEQDTTEQDTTEQDTTEQDTTEQDEAAEQDEDGLVVDPVVRAVDLTLRTRHGTVFAGVSLSVPQDRLGVICGPSGSGRSALLLSLCGRMRGLTGELTVAGLDGIRSARRIRAISSLARVSGLVDLEGQLTVADSITERSLIDGLHPRAGQAEFTAVAEQLGLDVDGDQLVAALPAPETTRLAVALACLRRPRLLLLDDLDRGLDLAGQGALLDTLTDLAATGITVLATTTDRTPVPSEALVHDLRFAEPPTDPEES